MDSVPYRFIDQLCYLTSNEIFGIESPRWKFVSATYEDRRRFHLFLKPEKNGNLRYSFVTVIQGRNYEVNTHCFGLEDVAAMNVRHFWLLGVCVKNAIPGDSGGFEISFHEFQNRLLPFARRRLFHQGMNYLTLLSADQALQASILSIYQQLYHFKKLTLVYSSKQTMKFLRDQTANNTRLRTVALEGKWPQSLVPLLFKLVARKNVACNVAETEIDLSFAFIGDLIENFRSNGGRCKVIAHCALSSEDLKTLFTLANMQKIKETAVLSEYTLQRSKREILIVKFEGTLLTVASYKTNGEV